MSTYLIIGATGRQGGGAAQSLLKAGTKVRALVRNPDSGAAQELQAQGAILFKGEAGDATSVAKAVEGATGVFFNPPFPDVLETMETFIKTCAAQPSVKTFVLSSTVGTEKHAEMMVKDPDYPSRHAKWLGYWSVKAGTEKIAREAGFQSLVILRAPLLHHIYLPDSPIVLWPTLWSERKLVTALKAGTKVAHGLGEDVGKFAAAALLDPGKFSGKELNLAADNLTSRELADVFGDVTGEKFEAPVPEFEGVEAVGVNYPIMGFHEWCNEFDATVDIAALKDYGVEMTNMRQFMIDHKAELLSAMGRK